MECYQLHYQRLVRALELAGAPHPAAEDLAQEAFARMLTHWRRVRGGSNPAGYAYRTAFRLLSRRRRQRAVATAGDADAARGGGAGRVGGSDGDGGDAGGVGGAVEEASPNGKDGPEGLVTTRLAVAAALATMPPRRRMCAVMCLVVGLPTSDVATALGITEGTVRKHVGDARDDLRHVLAS